MISGNIFGLRKPVNPGVVILDRVLAHLRRDMIRHHRDVGSVLGYGVFHSGDILEGIAMVKFLRSVCLKDGEHRECFDFHKN